MDSGGKTYSAIPTAKHRLHLTRIFWCIHRTRRTPCFFKPSQHAATKRSSGRSCCERLALIAPQSSLATVGSTICVQVSRRGSGLGARRSYSLSCTRRSAPSESKVLSPCKNGTLIPNTCFWYRWAAMGKIMEGRSDNDIKNRWYAMARHEQRIEKVVRASLQKPQTARSTTIPASAPLNLSRLDPGDPDTKAYVAQPSKRQRTNSGTRSTIALHESVQV